MTLQIKNLSVKAGAKLVINAASFSVGPKTVAALLGPNGSGKSSLANALSGHPKYAIAGGQILLDGQNITKLSPDQRSRAGLFLSPQHPPAIPGVSVANFLRLAVAAQTGVPQNPQEFYKKLQRALHSLNLEPGWAGRGVHVGFSGGERKRLEILELLMLKPKYAILDEIDSGVDVDALKIVATGINEAKKSGAGILLITHYNRILKLVRPEAVHIINRGKIIKSGGPELAKKIEKTGFQNYAH